VRAKAVLNLSPHWLYDQPFARSVAATCFQPSCSVCGECLTLACLASRQEMSMRWAVSPVSLPSPPLPLGGELFVAHWAVVDARDDLEFPAELGAADAAAKRRRAKAKALKKAATGDETAVPSTAATTAREQRRAPTGRCPATRRRAACGHGGAARKRVAVDERGAGCAESAGAPDPLHRHAPPGRVGDCVRILSRRRVDPHRDGAAGRRAGQSSRCCERRRRRRGRGGCVVAEGDVEASRATAGRGRSASSRSR